jgi:hypothetical protein
MVSRFDERVEYAVNNIWFKADVSLVDESLKKLREAANQGDGDAYYFLGRCYMGKSYVNPSLNLPLDVKFAYECFNMSLIFESAIGMFGTMHIEGFEPSCGGFVQPPYHSKLEIWNTVAKMSHSGNIFCKFLIASAYYYGYIADFTDIKVKGKALDNLRYKWDASAIKLYEECAVAGLGIAIPNLVELLSSGRKGEPIQLKKAEKYIRLGADMGIGSYERMVGNHYRKCGNGAMALKMYERALLHRDFYTYYCIGKLYTFNGILELDLDKAFEHFSKGYELFPDDYGFCNMLGEIYFYGGYDKGFNIKKDYEKAFYFLNKAYSLGSPWGADMLGTCYLYGYGTAVNLKRARLLFSLCPKKHLAIIGLEKLSKH